MSNKLQPSQKNSLREMIIDFRKHCTNLGPLHLNGKHVERVPPVKFLDVLICVDICWTANTKAITKKKAEQRLHFLRVLRKNNLCTNLITHCMPVCYSSCTCADREGVQRVVETAQEIITPTRLTSVPYAASAELKTSSKTAHTPALNCLTCCLLGGATEASAPKQTDSTTTSVLRQNP